MDFFARNDGGKGLLVRFWGVRGSLPTPGPGTVVYGGNTSCVEIRCGERLVVLDAGSGIVPMGRSLTPRPGETYDVLLSHCHHDHVQGLMFFLPLLTKNCMTKVYAGNMGGHSAEEPLTRLFSPPLFPVTFAQVPGIVDFAGFRAGEDLTLGDGLTVATLPLRHPSGATAYRFDHQGRRVCYVTDIEHDSDEPEPGLVKFVEGADLVIYDSMFTQTEFCRCRGWGHSTWQAGAALCRKAGARRLAAFHHNPKHDDEMLAGFDSELAAMLPGSFHAREGQTLVFPPVMNLVEA